MATVLPLASHSLARMLSPVEPDYRVVRPQTIQNHQKRGPAGAGVSTATVHVHTHNPPGQRLGCLFVIFDQSLPPNGVHWRNFGPDCARRSQTEKQPYLGLDGPNRDSEGTFSLYP